MSEPRTARVSLTAMRAPATGFTPTPTRRHATKHTPPAPQPVPPDAYALGFAAGEAAARGAHAAEREALLSLMRALQGLEPEPSEELAAMIATTVERLVCEIVATMPVTRDWLEARIARALALVAEADAARTLWLHPDDLELIGDADLALELRTDPAMARGAVRIDCSTGWIEDNRSIHLDALRALLGTGTAS